MNFGLFEAQSVFLQPRGPEAFENFYVPYGGESADSVRKRMFQTLMNIMQQKENRHVLVVSHNGACFSFLSQIWKDNFGKLPIHLSNCCIIKLGFSNNKFELFDIIDPTKIDYKE